MGPYSRGGNEPSHERRDEPLVVEEDNMVFNTIACTNTHINDGVGSLFMSCTSTAGDWDLELIALLQQQALANGNGQRVLLTTESDEKHCCD
jgi:hypothetical protein